MIRLINASALTVALLLSTAAFAEVPIYIGRHQSSSEDINSIMQLTNDFRAALMDKNVRQLSTLMFRSDILFASPASAATVKMTNDKEDVNFDGVPSGGYGRFAQFVGSTRESIEERFYNIKITRNVAEKRCCHIPYSRFEATQGLSGADCVGGDRSHPGLRHAHERRA